LKKAPTELLQARQRMHRFAQELQRAGSEARRRRD
jgi:hypothetical protein